MEVRDIQDIIDELKDHPHYVAGDIFVLEDCIDYINECIADDYGDDFQITENDLSARDKNEIGNYVSNQLYHLWQFMNESIYPDLEYLVDLSVIIDRQTKINQILNKNEE